MDQSQGHVKVIVVGDSGVGKSSLLLRFVNDEFNQFHEPTLGAAFLSKVHNHGEGKTTRFQVWDTAGQQKYKSIAPIYYRESQVALCVYDITSKNSFQIMKNWVDELKSKGPADILLAVVGNKIDKTDDEEVPFNQAKQYAQSISALFKLTSAKQGKGINELFTTISQKIEEDKYRKQQGNRQTIHIKNNQKDKNKKKSGCCGGSKQK